MKENQKNRIDEHDMTKKMMDTIRGGFKKVIKEQTEGDTITVLPTDAEYQDQLKKLETVHPSADITNFKIYPNDGNVIIDGEFLPNETQESGIVFSLALTAREVKIQMNGQNDLDNQVSQLLTRLEGYYDKWCEEWWPKMKNEYKPKEQ